MFSSPFSLVKSHGQRRPPCFAQGGLLGDAKPAAAQCDHISLGQLLRVGVFQGLKKSQGWIRKIMKQDLTRFQQEKWWSQPKWELSRVDWIRFNWGFYQQRKGGFKRTYMGMEWNIFSPQADTWYWLSIPKHQLANWKNSFLPVGSTGRLLADVGGSKIQPFFFSAFDEDNPNILFNMCGFEVRILPKIRTFQARRLIGWMPMAIGPTGLCQKRRLRVSCGHG